MKRSVMALVLLSLFVSGCAFGTRHPALGYTRGTMPKPVKNIAIYVAKFKDERVDKSVIGYVRNGYGMKTAKIITETDISDWVTDALKSELRHIGYTIVDNPNTDIKVEGEVIEVEVTSFMFYEGKVSVEVSLAKGGQELFTQKYKGKDESINLAARAKSYGITLERSLQEALVEAAYDIDRRLSGKRETE